MKIFSSFILMIFTSLLTSSVWAGGGVSIATVRSTIPQSSSCEKSIQCTIIEEERVVCYQEDVSYQGATSGTSIPFPPDFRSCPLLWGDNGSSIELIKEIKESSKYISVISESEYVGTIKIQV